MEGAPAKARRHAAAVFVPLWWSPPLSLGISWQKLATVYASPDTVAAPAVLKIEGVPTPLWLAAEDLAKLPARRLSCPGRNRRHLRGRAAVRRLVKAGWQFGRGMTGEPMASYLLATARMDVRWYLRLRRSIRSLPEPR